MSNFFDRTFSVLSELLLKLLPASLREKDAFSYYLAGLKAQSKGDYAKAMDNYLESLYKEDDSFDRSYLYLNIGIIFNKVGYTKLAIKYCIEATRANESMARAYYTIGSIYQYRSYVIMYKAPDWQKSEYSEAFSDKANEFFILAVKYGPEDYIWLRHWLICSDIAEEDEEGNLKKTKLK
uniref:Hypothetical chloroplast RF3 n=1 Tax=Climaconeis sp. TaxID=2846830 RepID=A0A8F8X7Z0_9STRA|nr:hypothetical chloroplast RF3 [Climaconeis sp.]